MPDTSSMGVVIVIIIILAILGLIYLRRLFAHFLSNFLENPGGRIMLGALLCIGGLIFGFTSSSVPYQSLSQKSVSLLIPHINTPDDGNVYLQDLSNFGVFYIIHDADFSPQVNGSNFQNGAAFTSLMYDGTTTQSIGVQMTSNFGSSAPIDGGTGYTVEQFSLNGATFTTANFQANPTGLYQNHWLAGGGIACAGLLLLVITFGIPVLSKRWEKASTAKPSSAGQNWPVSTTPPGIPHTSMQQPGVPWPPPNISPPQSEGFPPTPGIHPTPREHS